MYIKNKFKEALDRMLASDEFDKIEKFTETKTDKKLIQQYKAGLEKYGAANLPIIPLIMNANADILRDALIFMFELDETDNAESGN